MAFEKVGKVSDVPSGTAKVYQVGNREVAVCNVDGELYAIDDVCTHDEGSLDQGELDGHEIECPRHGARFDVRTGEVTVLPAVVPIDTFKVRWQCDDIEIEV
ncbi:MAG: non-heme iron oxygenase ferredoxin subunit [SAR202 cluster bacterium]|jgi:3-phenylpropionate/trans-cinnamate dioxygenase ferredoxin subunit|nr:non-heme iron oxygenase ferredoxin subunit [SAR202 cluster bacterium]